MLYKNSTVLTMISDIIVALLRIFIINSNFDNLSKFYPANDYDYIYHYLIIYEHYCIMIHG